MIKGLSINLLDNPGNIDADDWDLIRPIAEAALIGGEGIEWCQRERGADDTTTMAQYWLLICARETRIFYQRQQRHLNRLIDCSERDRMTEGFDIGRLDDTGLDPDEP